jgi:hypothetical protein
VDAFVGRHLIRGIRIGFVWRSRLGALGKGKHEDRPESASQKAEHARARVAAAWWPRVIPEQVEPVLLVPALRVCEREQNLSLLAFAARRKVAVHTRLGALGGEVATPAPNLGGSGLPGYA